MSTTGAIRTAIKGVLTAITPSIGAVHEYERWAVEWSRFLALMKDEPSGQIKAWTITRESGGGGREAPAESLRFPIYVVRGYRGLKDADETETAFDDDVERVQDALGAQTTLGGLVDHVEEPQVRVIEPRLFGEVLCHHAEITVRLQVGAHYSLVE